MPYYIPQGRGVTRFSVGETIWHGILLNPLCLETWDLWYVGEKGRVLSIPSHNNYANDVPGRVQDILFDIVILMRNWIITFLLDPRGTMPTGNTPPRGDQVMAEKSPKEQHPRLVVLAPANDTLGSNGGNHRTRRSTSTYGQNTCSAQSQPSCCLRQFYVNFKRNLGWSWIRQPKGYYPNYCAGSCSYVNGSVWSSETHHASVLDMYRKLNPDASPSPCCSPRSFKPLHILFYDKGRPLFRELPNAIVTSCQCS